MAFLRVQKLVRDIDGNLFSGSTAIKESQYVMDGGKFHSRQIVRERVLCHILHGVLREGSHISCDNFIEKSFASYILGNIPTATLRCDTAYFTMMSRDDVQMS